MKNNRKKTLIQALALVLSPGAALAQDVDVLTFTNGFQIVDSTAGNLSATTVSGAGDVNGDGLADLVIGASNAGLTPSGSTGLAFVVFGKSDSSPVDLNALGNRGFRINGEEARDKLGISVSGAGDVNGDGLDDIIVGAYGNDAGGYTDSGKSYVVFGKTTSETVETANLGAQGFPISGASGLTRFGISVSGAGDVNGDGLSDLVVGAYNVDSPGSAYVIFGKSNSDPVMLFDLVGKGFRINGPNNNSYTGISATGAGDVNGDGLDDMVIGAPGANVVNSDPTGAAYVIYGKSDSETISLGNLGQYGFAIEGVGSFDSTGQSVSGAGDVNGDGLADLIIGATSADFTGINDVGVSSVVYGKRTTETVDLGNLGSAGFQVHAVTPNSSSGSSVSGAGDVNGDGLADVLIGFRQSLFRNGGGAYVVYGKLNQQPAPLANLNSDGFRIFSSNPLDGFGLNASGAGDVNGDGLADVIVGAPRPLIDDETGEGSIYVVFSEQIPPTEATYTKFPRSGNPPQLALRTTGDGSNASHPDSRAWIDFSQVASIFAQITVTLIRNANGFADAAASVSWRFEEIGPFLSNAEITVRYLDSELLPNTNENSMRLVHSADGQPPFTWLPSVVEPQTNKISANVTELGYFYLGQVDDSIFSDGFE